MKSAIIRGNSGDKVKGLIFCSKISESEVLSDKLNNTINPETGRYYRTIALNGSASEEERQEAFERLAADEDNTDGRQPLDYILSVEGETPQKALIREIKEELTAEIEVKDLIRTVEYDYPSFHLSMDCFWAEIRSGQLVLKEALDSRWFSKEEFDTVKWLPADMDLIESIKQVW